MLRQILGVIAGLVVGVIVIGLVEGLGHVVYPPPEGVDLKDPEVLKSIMHTIPLGAKLAVLAALGLGVFAGGVTARKITNGATYAAWYLGLFLLAIAAYTMTQIPHPLWMVVGAFAVTLAGVFAANALTRANSA